MEREFILKGVSGRKIELDEVLIPQNALDFERDDVSPELVEHHEEVIPYGSEQSEPPPVSLELRRSGRIRWEPERYGYLVT